MDSTGKSRAWFRATAGGALACALAFAGGCASSFQREDPLARYEATQARLATNERPVIQQVSHTTSSNDQKDASTSKLPDLADLAPSDWFKSVKKAAGYGPKPDEARRTYAEAETSYNDAVATLESAKASPDDKTDFGAIRKRFSEVAEQYGSAAALWPDSAMEEDALFMAGESYFFADMYPKANEQFEKLLKKYPNSRYLDRVEAKRFSIARYWLLQLDENPEHFYEMNVADSERPWRDTRGHALRIFDKIRFDDPTGDLADDATLALGHTAFRSGDFVKADEYYTDLRITYPTSQHQFDAHYLGLQAKLLSYRGPDYAGDLLEQCEELIQQMKKRFPEEVETEREFLNRSYAEVRFRQAERIWSRASYHRIRQEYGPARYHAQQIAEKFSDTPFRERAEQLLADTAGKPALPAQRMAWLVNLFPESDPVKPLLKSDGVPAKRRK